MAQWNFLINVTDQQSTGKRFSDLCLKWIGWPLSSTTVTGNYRLSSVFTLLDSSPNRGFVASLRMDTGVEKRLVWGGMYWRTYNGRSAHRELKLFVGISKITDWNIKIDGHKDLRQ